VPERTVAFGPGRVNLIGEHTDYNEGLALPFAIAQGVTVSAHTIDAGGRPRIEADAVDLGEHEEFDLAEPGGDDGWRAFVRGVVAELGYAGFALPSAALEIRGDVPRGAGLSSSAALEVALCLALLDLAEARPEGRGPLQRLEIAQLCSRVENVWVGAHTGLLDQLASLHGAPDTAVFIDFASLAIEPVELTLEGWRLVILDSGEVHTHAHSGYNERRAECARACELLGVESLRAATLEQIETLPEPERLRARHIAGENERVRAAVIALRARDLTSLGELLNESHASQRDLFGVSTATVEATVARLRDAGAAGARMTGGGFGGSVLGLFAPGVEPPAQCVEVRPSAGAHLLSACAPAADDLTG
jgi:galactokinase